MERYYVRKDGKKWEIVRQGPSHEPEAYYQRYDDYRDAEAKRAELERRDGT